MSLDSKVNLSQLMGIDRLERWFEGLLQKVNHHEEAIQRLTNAAEGFARLDSVEKTLVSLQMEVRTLATRMDDIEKALLLQHNGASVSVPNAVQQMLRDVAVIDTRLANSVTKDAFAEMSSTFENRCAELEVQCHDQFATRELADRLLSLQDDTMQRLAATEAITATKADKSQLTRIETAAAQLEHFVTFKGATDRLLQQLSQRTETLQQDVSDHNTRISDILAVAEGLQSTVEASATRDDLEATRLQLVELQHEVASCARQSGVEELLTTYPRLQAELSILQQALEDTAVSHDARIGIIERQAANWVTLDRLNGTVQKKSSELESRINHVLSTTPRKSDVQQISVAFEALRTELEKTDEKAALAVRFVDWFTERGDAYEHNLHTVDKHLSKLSETSTTGRREPSALYSLRFP